jgi:hypothetical protein
MITAWHFRVVAGFGLSADKDSAKRNCDEGPSGQTCGCSPPLLARFPLVLLLFAATVGDPHCIMHEKAVASAKTSYSTPRDWGILRRTFFTKDAVT